MASSIGSSAASAQLNGHGTSTSHMMLRNRAFANQESMITDNPKKPLYFVNTSNGHVASDPNTLRDMGRVRNCVYQFDTDATDQIVPDRNVKWKDLIQGDKELKQLLQREGDQENPSSATLSRH